MSVTVLCHGCGQGVPVPEGHGRLTIRCPACGVQCDVPSAVSPFGVSAVPLPPLASGGADEDDGKPYDLPADPEPKAPCPNCRKSMPRDAVVCVHCGFNQDTGETLERLYQTVDKQWETGLRFQVRFGIFLAVGGLALAATLVVGLAGGDWVALVVSFLVGVALLAYVLGTYPRINLARNRKGKVRLTKTWRICFIARAATDIRWRTYEGVVVGPAGDADFWDWAVVLFLLPWGCLPAVLWWAFMIHPGQFHAALCQGHGFAAFFLYRGPSQALAQEIAAAVRDVTGLPPYPRG